MRIAHEPSLDASAYSYVHRLRVRFAETDAMGIVHHAAYLPYLEEARVEWLRAIGHPYQDLRIQGFDFAVLEVYTRYVQPLRFDDLVDVHLSIVDSTRTTMQIAYLLEVEGQARSTAVTVHGCVDTTGRPVRLPAWVRDVATGG